MTKAFTYLLLSLCVFSTLSMNYEQLTKDVFDKINMLRQNPTKFASLIDKAKYPKFYAKVMESSQKAPPLKLSQGLSLAVAHRGQKILSTKNWDFSKPKNVAQFATNVQDPTFFTIGYNWKSKDGVHAISESSNRMTYVVDRLRSGNYRTMGIYCGCYCPTLRLCSMYLSGNDDVKSVEGAKVQYLKESTTGSSCRKTEQMMPEVRTNQFNSQRSSSSSGSGSSSSSSSSGNSSSSGSSNSGPDNSSKVPLSCLPTSPKNYQQLAKDAFVAQNHLRQNPKQWASYMKWLKQYFDQSGRLQTPGMNYKLATNEGTVPVQESYDILSQLEVLPAFIWDDTLARAAQKHVIDTSFSPVVLGHTSRNGESFGSRVSSFFTRYSSLGENIAYGPKTGIDQIRGLFIDDGVANRGHRKSILSTGFDRVGVACGCFDNMFRVICVFNYGSGLVSKTPDTPYKAINNQIGQQCSWPKSPNPFKAPPAIDSCQVVQKNNGDQKKEDQKIEDLQKEDQKKEDLQKEGQKKEDQKKEDQKKEEKQKKEEEKKEEKQKKEEEKKEEKQKKEEEKKEEKQNKDEEKKNEIQDQTGKMYYRLSKQIIKLINELRTEKGKEMHETDQQLMGLQQVEGWNLLAAQFHSKLRDTMRVEIENYPQNLFRYAYGFAKPYDADIIYSDKKDIKISSMQTIILDNMKESNELKQKIFNGDYTSVGVYCSCHKYTPLFCVVFFSSGQEVSTNKNGEKVAPNYSKGQELPALNCEAVKQVVPSKNASPFNILDFIPHQAQSFDDLVDEVFLNLNHLRMKPKIWRGYLQDYYLEFITDDTGYFPKANGEVLQIDLSNGSTESVEKVINRLARMRVAQKLRFSPGLSNYAKALLMNDKRQVVKNCGKGWRNVARCFVNSLNKRQFEFEIQNVSNGQNTVARLLTLATKNYLPYRVIRWRGITDVGIACGCDGTEGNKCVIVFGRSVVERPDVKPFKSSTANIGETCDIGARESQVKVRDVQQFIMEN